MAVTRELEPLHQRLAAVLDTRALSDFARAERLTGSAAPTAREESAEPNPDPLPVLASRAPAAEDITRRLFPTTTASRLTARDAVGRQYRGSAADAAGLRCVTQCQSFKFRQNRDG